MKIIPYSYIIIIVDLCHFSSLASDMDEILFLLNTTELGWANGKIGLS